MMFDKILIANRGEIAIRIIKACRELGIKTVAVYSKVDRDAMHIRFADEAIYIGESEPQKSYLNIDNIIAAAKQTGSKAIHPGYGFLSENYLFADRCIQEKIVFIGPNPKAMRLVGDKVASREIAAKNNIPLIPGMEGKTTSIDECIAFAEKCGYPVMLKASAGGGGKGMRIIWSKGEARSAIESGMREAQAAFGDSSVYMEKYLEQPRHVEIQVLADNFGNAVHLCERECSIQRRHQKIIEESPSVIIDSDLRRRMGETALKVVAISGYSNAGTVEFLVDTYKNFYFLEVNARLQVEHPVTELVTGMDLVHAQLRIAAGERLWLKQEDIYQNGHAIECRIYAEDPGQNFLPSAGKILFMNEPSGPGIRHDCGVMTGSEISVYYDPILSKLIAWAPDRETCCKRMSAALADFPILGIRTNIEFLHEIITQPEFTTGNLDTGFIERNLPNWSPSMDTENSRQALIAAALYNSLNNNRKSEFISAQAIPSPWELLGDWRIGSGK
jgi:acetyl-CoA carboxylase biotin carboxylase subunit